MRILQFTTSLLHLQAQGHLDASVLWPLGCRGTRVYLPIFKGSVRIPKAEILML